MKVVITGHLLPALPILLYQLSTLSLSHPPGHITPIHHPGCGVTSSGSPSWTLQVGWVPVSNTDAPSDPWDPFTISLHPSLASFCFPFRMLLLPAAHTCDSPPGKVPGTPGHGMYSVPGCRCLSSQQPLAKDQQGGSLEAQVLPSWDKL